MGFRVKCLWLSKVFVLVVSTFSNFVKVDDADLERVIRIKASGLKRLEVSVCRGTQRTSLQNINNLTRLRHSVTPFGLKIDYVFATEKVSITTLKHARPR